MKRRINKIHNLKLPTHYSYLELLGNWLIFEDRYISLGDTIERDFGGKTHKVIDVFEFEEEVLGGPFSQRPTETKYRQAIKISGVCSPKVGDVFYVL